MSADTPAPRPTPTLAQLLDAIRFLTILPVPDSARAPEPDWLTRAMTFFPIVGVGIGVISATVLVLGSSLFGPGLAALLAVAASVMVTGALHEDGLADTFDSFGGGWSVERRLEIMKDSRLGTYGGLALGLDVALRATALAQLPLWAALAALVACHAGARATPGFVKRRLTYAGNIDGMKVAYAEEPMRKDETALVLVTVALAALPLLLISPVALIAGLGCGAALAALMTAWAKRLLGGYTGDVLGAIEQMFEIGFLLGVAAVLAA
ncbi:cobalamin 5'-phosphate synthase [Rhodopseudomonas sp. AAP120]|uniref:adenosylcobinamide-GDP ribazoletransferase n=1 Tax=Rhodopseudomonas sp. AAP120 TaxID=1523430 RepID=UPI0006B92A77|nr:adenosylcobinamide-GDP ribazoletransferase [Rhodopseudomonas sp. AAP120]KPF94813.1 cobalamin 5'-phosphate synthase [Rhodopseudomonas sp. AAP120]